MTIPENDTAADIAMVKTGGPVVMSREGVGVSNRVLIEMGRMSADTSSMALVGNINETVPFGDTDTMKGRNSNQKQTKIWQN